MISSEQFRSRNLTLPKVNMRLVSLLFAFVQKKYGLAGKPFSKEIFVEICKGENICPIFPEADFVADGYYFKHKKGLFIFIRKGFLKAEFLEIAGHELGHHFLNHLNAIGSTSIAFNPTATTRSNLSRYMRKLIEVEADYFSSLICGPEND